MDYPAPKPRRVSVPSWLDLRLILGVASVVVSVGVGALVVSSARRTDRELAVTHALAAGTTLQPADLQLVDVRLPGGRGDLYLRDAARATGRVLSRPMSAGELVPAAAVVPAPARTTVSIPFAADAAPPLHRGERIEVWLSSKACPTVPVLGDVTVQDVQGGASGVFGSTGTGQAVVLSVPSTLADRAVAALAVDGATLRAGVLSGSSPASGGAGDLPPLDGCEGSS